MTTSDEIYNKIKENFTKKSYLVLPQVRNHPGSDGIRTADAIAISQSALRGVEFVGFEVKTSKSDFNEELKQVDKADEIAQFCNRWFIAAPKGIVKVEYLPKNWGLLELSGNRLNVIKNAPEIECKQPSREFVAALIRRVEKEIGLKKEYWRGYDDGIAAEKKRNDTYMENLKKENDELNEKIKIFEKYSGIDFGWWHSKDEMKLIGNIVRLVYEGEITDRFNHCKDTIVGLLEDIKRAEIELNNTKMKINYDSAKEDKGI